eukprot:Clim_evm56s253 gene=Clim_evmTU56s253
MTSFQQMNYYRPSTYIDDGTHTSFSEVTNDIVSVDLSSEASLPPSHNSVMSAPDATLPVAHPNGPSPADMIYGAGRVMEPRPLAHDYIGQDWHHERADLMLMSKHQMYYSNMMMSNMPIMPTMNPAPVMQLPSSKPAPSLPVTFPLPRRRRQNVSDTTKRPFACNWPGCNKTYMRKPHLKAHIRTHTGEKIYQCKFPDCNERFVRSDQLTRHHRSHTNEKPFKCRVCSLSFARSEHCSAHEFIHFKAQHDAVNAAIRPDMNQQ